MLKIGKCQCLSAFKQVLFSTAKQHYRDTAELALRLITAVFMLTHGWGKVFHFSEKMEYFPDPLGLGSVLSLSLAGFAEFFCSLLLLAGLFTRFAALNLLITMLTAGLVFHWADPFGKKELALLYAVVFVYFVIVGGNRFSLDECLRKKYLK